MVEGWWRRGGGVGGVVAERWQRRGGGAAAHAPLQMIKCGKLKIDGREKTLFSSGEGQERYVKSYRIDVGGKKTLIYEKVNLCN